MDDEKYVDVLVIGAGLSGVLAAYYLQSRCPNRTFAILEARDAIGGTWDLFRYPGIRSDSDMHTLGFSFFPWKDPQAIADGPSIRNYIQDAVREYGLERHIQFNTRVVSATWSSDDSRWTVTTRTGDQTSTVSCNFLWGCTGYYRYSSGYSPEFEGSEDFQGTIIHPQHWPQDLDYADKNIVVIGSGATAVTLVPELAKTAKNVTMLQRSPTYVMSLPSTDGVADFLTKVFGTRTGSNLTRWKNVFRSTFFYKISKAQPNFVRNHIIGEARSKLNPDFDVDTHFSPTYKPWDQRVCFVPDDDLFEALNRGDAEVVTANIDRFDKTGIALENGEHLDADIIVTATGLQLQMLGGARLDVDGEPVNPGASLMYKGLMLSDVPNLALSLGYTNASWTLKCELIAEYVTRLLNHMDADNATQVRPIPPDQITPTPLLDFYSGYVLRALDQIPKQGAKAPWRLYQNYALDLLALRYQSIEDGVLKFRTS